MKPRVNILDWCSRWVVWLAIAAALLAGLCRLSAGQTVLAFESVYCPPCRQMHATLDELRSRGVEVQTVMWDSQPKAFKQYDVSTTPTYVAIDGEYEVGRIVGPTSLESLERIARKVAEKPAVIQDRSATAICRIEVADGSKGTGTLIGTGGGYGTVLTCWHLFRGSRQCRVEFEDASIYPAQLIATDLENDYAVLRIREPPVEPVLISPDEPGNVLHVAGFGGSGMMRSVSGRTVPARYTTSRGNRYTVIDASVRQGDSGGPILTEAGYQVGVISAQEDGLTYAVCGRPLRTFLSRVFPGWSERRRQRDSVYSSPGGYGSGGNPPTPSPDPPPVYPGPSTYDEGTSGPSPADEPPGWSDWQREIETSIASLEENKQPKGDYLTTDYWKGEAEQIATEIVATETEVGTLDGRVDLIEAGKGPVSVWIDGKLTTVADKIKDTEHSVLVKYTELQKTVDEKLASSTGVQAASTAFTLLGIPVSQQVLGWGATLGGPVGLLAAGLVWWRLKRRISGGSGGPSQGSFRRHGKQT